MSEQGITRQNIRWEVDSRTRPDRKHHITLDPSRGSGYAWTCEAGLVGKCCWAVKEVKAGQHKPIIRLHGTTTSAALAGRYAAVADASGVRDIIGGRW